MKISKLEKKLKEERLNHTTMNIVANESNDMSMERKMNATAFDLGEDRNKIFVELEELKKKNSKLLSENNRLKSEIPVVSSRN